jgi:hypothetical protein
MKLLPPQYAAAVADLLVKNIDAPGVDELVDRIKKLVPIGIRGKEPGEEEPQQQPDPEIILKQLEMTLKRAEAERKEFDSQIKAITSVMDAEAKERGNQRNEMYAFMKEIREGVKAFSQMKGGGPPPGGHAGPGPQPPGTPPAGTGEGAPPAPGTTSGEPPII